MNERIESIVEKFSICGTYGEGKPFGNGHINETFLIKTKEADCDDYILQKVNHYVFRNVEGLMRNMQRVTDHIRNKLKEDPQADIKRNVITIIPAKDDTLFYKDKQGEYWRILLFIDGGHSYDIVDSPQKAYMGGRAFGNFQKMLSDFPPPPLVETIPNFHNIEMRLQTFFQVVKDDPKGRVKEVKDEIADVEKRKEEMKTLYNLGKEGKIPMRITHNDTKFNNILFDNDDNVLCILDLDTVMPGYIHFDFGDAIRSGANTGAEDDKDLSRVSMNIDLFKAYSRGFLEETHDFLNDYEIDNLAFSAKLFAFSQALRFLTDYIAGDVYYKIHYPHHNLQRTKAQFALLFSMEKQYDEMRAIIDKISDDLK